MKNEIYEKKDILEELMGTDALLNELVQAMSAQELEENIEFIARMNDINLED